MLMPQAQCTLGYIPTSAGHQVGIHRLKVYRTHLSYMMVTTSRYRRKLAEKYFLHRSPSLWIIEVHRHQLGFWKLAFIWLHIQTHTQTIITPSGLTFIWLLTLTALLQSVPLSHPSEKWAATPWSMRHSYGDVTFKLLPLREMTQQPVRCRKLALFKHWFSWETALLSFIGGKRMWEKK